MGPEFDLIRRHFTHTGQHTLLGVGDDAALLAPTPGTVIAVSSDMLVAGRHFITDTDPERLGHKAMAVNLSDLAAMGATPRWALLALALPRIEECWVEAFARGFQSEARSHGVDWVGGDTTGGPLNLAVTILGEVDPRKALRRSGGRAGDDVWVSGTLGDAALGLAALQNRFPLTGDDLEHCVRRLEQPTARVALGQALAGVAHAALDVSDGLLADLGHVLEASGVGADLEFDRVPVSAALRDRREHPLVREAILAGGDDYELCFTADPSAAGAVLAAAAAAGTQVQCIGSLSVVPGLRVRDRAGQLIVTRRRGYDHFAEQAQQ